MFFNINFKTFLELLLIDFCYHLIFKCKYIYISKYKIIVQLARPQTSDKTRKNLKIELE